MKWLRKAASLKEPWATNYLGIMYQSGRGGLPTDQAQAEKLFRTAAELGFNGSVEASR